MLWSAGYVGVVLHLGGTGKLLNGYAESFFDYREGDRTPARAERNSMFRAGSNRSSGGEKISG